jgi:hypothetical protein
MAAFVDIGLAVGFSFDTLNLTGVALTTLSTVTSAIVTFGNGHCREAGRWAGRRVLHI